MRTKHATKLYRLAAAAARSAPPSALCAPWPSALLGWPWHQCTRCCARWCTPNEAVAGAVRAWQRGALSGLSVRPCCSTMRQRATWSPAPAARERFSICHARARVMAVRHSITGSLGGRASLRRQQPSTQRLRHCLLLAVLSRMGHCVFHPAAHQCGPGSRIRSAQGAQGEGQTCAQDTQAFP